MPVEPLQSVQSIVTQDSRYQNVASRFAFLDSSHFHNQQTLFPILTLTKPRSILEVGSWMGASARFMASFPFVEEVVSVDHWDRNRVENWVPGRHPEDWMDFMYEHFLANCVHANLAHKMYPLRLDSIAGAHYLMELGKKFDLIYIDGAHATVMVRQDLRNFYPMLKPQGIFCGDDWVFNKEPENVQLAVTEFVQEYRLQAYAIGNFWWCDPKQV